jgi:hypothetical protein
MYETLHTGLRASEHGIVSNIVRAARTIPTIFQLAVEAAKNTAAAASFLVFGAVYYDTYDDRSPVDDCSLLIQHGRFTPRIVPDIEVFAAAAMLVRKYSGLPARPSDGHGLHWRDLRLRFSEYRNHAIIQDTILSPDHRVDGAGYSILVTGITASRG